MPIDRKKLDRQLILEEGLRLFSYRDGRGFLSIGVGRNLDTNPLTPQEIAIGGSNGLTGYYISREGAILCLHNDEDKAMGMLDAHTPWWESLDEIRARVMVILCFNMGWRSVDGKHGLSTFNHFLNDMHEGDYDLAAADLRNSVWYGQVGNRGPRLVGMVNSGQDYTS